jgi:hypothetical protein
MQITGSHSRRDEIHVVFDHAEGVAALFVEPQDRVTDRIEQRPVHAGADLIEKHDLCIHHHGAAKLEQLLLAAGQIAGKLVGHMCDLEKLETSSALARLTRSSSLAHAAGCSQALNEAFT